MFFDTLKFQGFFWKLASLGEIFEKKFLHLIKNKQIDEHYIY
jgi:hypothetical protein